MANEITFEQWGDAPSAQLPAGVPPNLPRLRVTPQRTESTLTPPESQEPGYVEDTTKSLLSGTVLGATGLAGLPELIGRLGTSGYSHLADFLGDRLKLDDQQVQDLRKALVEGTPLGFMSKLPSAKTITKATEENVTGPLYEPKYMPGQFAHTVGEFLPGSVLGPGGFAGAAGNVAKFGVVPGVTSEAAGQLTKGTVLETPARILGGLLGAGTAAVVGGPTNTARILRGQMPPGVTPQMVDHAERLMQNAQRQGVDLTWPEALSQTAGRPILSDTMRQIEAAPSTQARMGEFYGQRPQQVEAAGRSALDRIAPPNYAPHDIGATVGETATDVLERVRGEINARARPHYTAAERTILPAHDMARVRALPGYGAAHAAVLADPQLRRYVMGLPENSIGFLNEVKKQLDRSAANATHPMAPHAPNTQVAAGYTSDAAVARQTGVNRSTSYERALETESDLRTRILDPLSRGPLGKLAKRDQPTENAINALFPANPLPNSEHQIDLAMRLLASQHPRAAADLVRAHAEMVFNRGTTALQSGPTQAGASKFFVKLVGNPQQRANFEAAVSALPNGAERLAGFNRFLDVAEAIGTRQNIGSKTAYNVEFMKEASKSGVVGETLKGATKPLDPVSWIGDKVERWKLGHNLNELADILTNPNTAHILRGIARMPPNSPTAARLAMRLMTLGSGATAGDRQ